MNTVHMQRFVHQRWMPSITFEHGIPNVQLEGSDSNKNKAVITLVQAISQPSVSFVQPEVTYFYDMKICLLLIILELF